MQSDHIAVRSANSADIDWLYSEYLSSMEEAAAGVGVMAEVPQFERSLFTTAIADHDWRVEIAESDGRLAGFIMMYESKENCDLATAPYGEVLWVSVGAGFDAAPVVGKFIDSAKQWFQARGISKLLVAHFASQGELGRALEDAGFTPLSRRMICQI
ncbi:hypothetical protein IIA79_04615 [bacterium]|nr:hypothetical protein [bacterium]